jgi:hypothetical protein
MFEYVVRFQFFLFSGITHSNVAEMLKKTLTTRMFNSTKKS